VYFQGRVFYLKQVIAIFFLMEHGWVGDKYVAEQQLRAIISLLL